MAAPRRPLPIDWDDLEIAFDWNDPEGHAYLDRETGEVIQWSDLLGEDEREEIAGRNDDDPGRYERIEPIGGDEGWRWMADFTATVSDRALRSRLEQAARGRGAFGRWKRALGERPAELERWYGFREERLRAAILSWLGELGIEAASPPPWRSVPGEGAKGA